MKRVFCWILVIAAYILAAVGMVWSIGAVAYDLPWPSLRAAAAVSLVAGFAAALLFLRGHRRKLTAVTAIFSAVLVWWLTLRPSDERDWLPDVARTASAEIHGNEIVFHNVRNCDYRTEKDYTARWETRTVDLTKLTGIDLAIDYWGSPYIAHPIVSFQFSDAPPLCFSIETRKETGESYSAIGGIYRHYELIYIVADERDVIRVRTNYRKREDIYLYHLNITPEKARARLLEYVSALDALHDKPRWYNAVTTNCTTSIRSQHVSDNRVPWDWRILLNGKADEMLYERGAVRSGGLPFDELKKRSRINDAARAADDAPDFSARIRAKPLPPAAPAQLPKS